MNTTSRRYWGTTPTALRGRATCRGFTLLEVTLSLAVLLSASVLLTQFLVASSQQRRVAHQRRLALQEVANRMERVLAVKYDDVTAAAIEKEELSAQAMEQLPAAKLTASVTDEAGPPAGKRVRLEISWEQVGDRVKPVGLTVWRYQSLEGQP